MNTVEGRAKGVLTMREKYGDNIYSKIGSKGGKNSSNRPMKDPSYASRLAKIRWAKYKLEHNSITRQEYDQIMVALKNGN